MEKKRTIGSLLVEFGFITEDELNEALARQRETGRRIGEVLVDTGKVSRQDIEWVLSKQLDIPYIIPDEQSLDMELISRFPSELLTNNRILPMNISDDEIAIATDDPFNTQAFEEIACLAGDKQVVLSACDGETLDAILKKIYRREAVPELVALLGGIIESIRDTSFYRLDFMLEEYATHIAAFGAGILRPMHSGTTAYRSEDILRAMNAIGLKYLHEGFQSNGSTLLLVYPLENEAPVRGYPAVLGGFGLHLSGATAFTDTGTGGMHGIFQSPVPVAGYEYLALKRRGPEPGRTIYTLDNVPPGFPEYHVRALLPRPCACEGEGCVRCRGLGYTFERLEGTYDHEQIMKAMREGRNGED